MYAALGRASNAQASALMAHWQSTSMHAQVLTSLQDARLHLAAFPWAPDIDAICTVLRGWDSYSDLPANRAQQASTPLQVHAAF